MQSTVALRRQRCFLASAMRNIPAGHTRAGVGHVQVSYSHPSRGAAIRSFVVAAATASHLAVDSHCSAEHKQIQY